MSYSHRKFYKVIVIGDMGTGKTSLLDRITKQPLARIACVGLLLVGTKLDLADGQTPQRIVSKEEADVLASRMCCPYIEISSKDSVNVEEAFNSLLDIIMNGFTRKPLPPLKVTKLIPKKPTIEYHYGLCDKTSGKRMFLQDVKHSLLIHDFMCKFVSTQTYKNTSKEALELIYRFPVLYSSPVDLVCVFFDPKTKKRETLRGKVVKKSECQERYDDVIAEGNTAVMLEQEQNAVFSVQLGNVQPGIEITVIITTMQELRFEKIVGSDSIQMMGIITAMDEDINQKREFSKVVSVEAEICMSGVIEKVTSNEKIVIDKTNESRYFVKTSDKLTVGNDFELNVVTKKYPLFNFVVHDTPEGSKYPHVGCLSFIIDPKSYESESSFVKNLSLIIIVDCSGSMAGKRMRVTKTSLKLLIQSLDPNRSQILINIVKFGSSHESLFKKPKKLTESSYKEVMEYVEKLDSNLGGTNIFSPVDSSLKMEVDNKFAKTCVLVTDGEDSNSEKIIDLVKSESKGTRFFTFTIGENVNPFLCDELAKITDGRSVCIKDLKEINSKVIGQVSHLTTGEVVDDISVDLPNSEMNSLKDGFLNSGYSQYMLMKSLSPCKVSFSFGEKKFEEELNPKKVNEELRMDILWAQQRIQNLEKSKSKDSLERIQEIALENNLVSSQTSILVVRENEEKVTTEIVREKVRLAREKKTIREFHGSRGGLADEEFFVPDQIVDLCSAPSKSSCCGGGSGRSSSSRAREETTTEVKPRVKPKKKKKEEKSKGSVDEKKEVEIVIPEANEKEESAKQERKEKNDVGDLTPLLLLQTMSGMWKCNEEVAKYLDMKVEDIQKACPKSEKEEEDLFMTAVVVVFIRSNYPEKSDEWRFIVEKSVNLLESKNCSDLLLKANELFKK